MAEKEEKKSQMCWHHDRIRHKKPWMKTQMKGMGKSCEVVHTRRNAVT